ncbi:MAG: DUF1804 family protein [Desulfuromusa sp.]|nr:DUF1804 family protein [Desulfuromusa sp.]
MAEKGDRARLEPFARQRYIETGNLTLVAEELEVSRQTLTTWKTNTLKPGEEFDEWDKARQQKASNVERLRSLFNQELQHLEDNPTGALNPASMDALTKLGSLVQRWEKMEEESRQRETAGAEFDRPAVFLENIEWLAKTMNDIDPEGLKVLARNFDHLIIQFKAEHA